MQAHVSLQTDPTYCPVHLCHLYNQFQAFTCNNYHLLNYPNLPPPPPHQPTTQAYIEEHLNIYITLLIDIHDLACQMLIKIARMLLAILNAFNPLVATQHPFTRFLKGHNQLS